jgi:hypothetical protein
MYIMSNEKNKEDPELSNSQESTATYPSEALIEKDSELTAKKPAEERKVVVKPSEVEYKAKYTTFLVYCSVTLIPATPFFIS